MATSIPRRWIPESGLQEYREKIHKESKIADKKNLPFTFSKPWKAKKQSQFKCGCGHIFLASKNTVMVICSKCKQLSKVEKM
jgi:hypothetical protein